MAKKGTISVCFPAYNEEDNIIALLDKCMQVTSKLRYDCEILVLNDGSTDNTEAVAKEYAKTDKRVRVLSHSKNKGYATTVNSCFSNGSGEILFVVDSDLQYDLADIGRFIDEMDKGCDVVVGQRKRNSDSSVRRVLSKGYSFCFRVLFGKNDRDIDCGFRCIRRQFSADIELTHTNVPVGAEFFAHFYAHKLKVGRVEINHVPRKAGKSLFGTFKLPLIVTRALFDMFKLRLEWRRG